MKKVFALFFVLFSLSLLSSDLEKQEQLNKELFDYVSRWNLKKVEKFLKKGANVNAKKSGATPLFYAVVNGDIEMVKLLLKNGAKVNILQNNETALDRAVYYSNVEIIKLLIDRGSITNYPMPNDISSDIAKFLLANGSSSIAQFLKHSNPEISTLIQKYSDFVKKMKEKKIDLPYIKRIKEINDLVSRNIQKEYKFKNDMHDIAASPLIKEIWPLIFSYNPENYLNLMRTCQYFYKKITEPSIIKYLIVFLPLDKEINYLNTKNPNNIEIPKMIMWDDVKKLAKEHNIEL